MILVVATGCYDLLHLGHIHILSAARKLGDKLIVGINSDASIKRLKGPTRPILPEEIRAEMLLALRCVDGVRIFDEDTPERLLCELRPQVFVKGADWLGRHVPEAIYAERVVFIPLLEGWSTTNMIQRIRGAYG